MPKQKSELGWLMDGRVLGLKNLLQERDALEEKVWILNQEITELAGIESNYAGLVAGYSASTILNIAKTRLNIK